MKYISTVCYTNGDSNLRYQRKICKYCFNRGKEDLQKRVKLILLNNRKKKDWNIVVQDESIFVYDYVVRRKKWISAEKRPLITVTGSRKRTIVFGCLSKYTIQIF
jgi:hypothetical protein